MVSTVLSRYREKGDTYSASFQLTALLLPWSHFVRQVRQEPSKLFADVAGGGRLKQLERAKGAMGAMLTERFSSDVVMGISKLGTNRPLVPVHG